MQMQAITDIYGFGEAAMRAINAGVDIILNSNNINYDQNEVYRTRDVIFKAIKNGDILEEKIIESLI